MVNQNLVNLINNEKPFETVCELKDYEIKKSPLSPAAKVKVIKKYGGNYQSSRVGSEDIALTQMYGPGFWDEFFRPIASAALAISYAIPPLAAVTVPVSVVVGVAGAGMATFSDDSDVKEFGAQMVALVGEAGVGHVDGSGSENAHKAKLLANFARNR